MAQAPITDTERRVNALGIVTRGSSGNNSSSVEETKSPSATAAAMSNRGATNSNTGKSSSSIQPTLSIPPIVEQHLSPEEKAEADRIGLGDVAAGLGGAALIAYLTKRFIAKGFPKRTIDTMLSPLVEGEVIHKTETLKALSAPQRRLAAPRTRGKAPTATANSAVITPAPNQLLSLPHPGDYEPLDAGLHRTLLKGAPNEAVNNAIGQQANQFADDAGLQATIGRSARPTTKATTRALARRLVRP